MSRAGGDPSARRWWMNSTTASRVTSGASRCGEWPTPGTTTRRHGPRTPRSMASSWASAAVLVVGALDQQDRTVDRRQALGDVPTAEIRRQPDVVPAAERRVGVAVVARHALRRDRRAGRRRGPPRCRRSSGPRRTRAGARRTSPATAWLAPAYSRAIEAPSLWPISTGRTIPSRSSNSGSTASASWCM